MANKIRLEKIKLTNFKGIRKGEYAFNGQNAVVYGENGTGKTTLMDAMLWVLFGRDSLGRADFGIKTLDDTGATIPNIDHEVECVFSGNSETTISLRKNYREKWTKRRGSASATFRGHETEYYVNDVPEKKGEFEAFVRAIIDEKTFQLLTNPLYFNESLSWKERRDVLIDLCGDVTASEVVESNKKLAVLLPELKDKSPDDLLKVAAAKRKALNKEIAELETRISEAHLAAAGEKFDENSLREERLKLETELDMAKYANPNDKKRSQINALDEQANKLQADLLELKKTHENLKDESVSKLSNQEQAVKAKVYTAERRKSEAEGNILQRNQRIDQLKKAQSALRDEWKEIDRKYPMPFAAEGGKATCQTCGQALPEEAMQQAVAKVNTARAKEKERINLAGKELGRQIEAFTAEVQSLNADLANIVGMLDAARAEIERIEAEMDVVNSRTVETDAKFIALTAKIADTEAQKSTLELQTEPLFDDQSKANALKEAIADIDRKLFAVDEQRKQQARVDELAKRKVAAGKEFEEVERTCALIEAFVRAKVGVLENRINDKFAITRFKMFETQINGGITETCEAVYNGVPYGAGLNNAMRINVGLDIINTLSKLYGLSAPVFVDNAESVTTLRPIDSQVIQLVVKEGQKMLKVETRGGKQ